MIATIVHVYVKSESIDSFVEATIENSENSVKEPGNLRFDFLQDAAVEGKFILYEAYESESAAAAHKETAHYIKWRDTVKDWMSQPREGVKHTIIRPMKK